MLDELRFACRTLLRSRGYAGAAVITLALGLGVNIAVATVAWSVLLRPLPIAEPSRVVMIYPTHSGLERVRQPIAFLKFKEWRARNRVFEEVAVSTPLTIQLSDARGYDLEAAAVSDNFLRLLGVRRSSGDVAMTPDLIRADPGYFEALGIPLRAGRGFTEDDRRVQEPVVIVNEAMARLHWPGQNPVGQRLKYQRMRPTDPWAVVVGVVGDVRSRKLHEPPRPQLYSPLNESSQIAGALRLLVKTHLEPSALAPAVFTALRELSPRVRLLSAQPMQEVFRLSIVDQEYQSDLIGSFAALALVLASAGIYGLLNYRVARRRREIAIRMALGATRLDVAHMVLRRAAALVLPGLALGVAVALATTRLLRGLLFGISTTDPLTFTLVPMLFIVVAVLASLAPTRRAVGGDVAVTLREV